MFDAPADVPSLWIGVATASLVVAGVGAGLPTTTAPDATAAAATVDRVAATPYPATAEHPISADRVKIGPNRIALRDDRGTSHATFAYGPVVPARDGKFRAILEGTPPSKAFGSPAAFERAVGRGERRNATWRPADDALVVRTATWHGVTVTVVGV